jgi:hypothetical protein
MEGSELYFLPSQDKVKTKSRRLSFFLRNVKRKEEERIKLGRIGK